MVLQQYPDSSDNNRLAAYAEADAKNAGMQVVPIESYLKKYKGERLYVSRWEGHPNERAHKIFAEMLLPSILNHRSFEEYMKNHSTSTP